MPAEEAPPSAHGRGIKIVLALVLGMACAAVAVEGLGGRTAQTPQTADMTHKMELYGHRACPSCQGGGCHCAWANADTCSSKSYSTDCCWSCCCGQGGFHQHSMPGASYWPTSGAYWPAGGLTYEDRDCHVSDGQGVHVKGNSGNIYYGTVMGYQGNGMYQVAIDSKPYPIHSEYISECTIANALLTFWLPLLLAIAVLCCILFVVYKKVKTGKLPDVPDLVEPPKRRCCAA